MDVFTAQGAVEVSDNPRVAVGGNNPPLTPYEALIAHIDDLEMEARNHLDGTGIQNEEQATAVSRILDDARKARQAAEEQRKLEAKPFDEGKAAVQALWTPLTNEKTGRCALIADTCKKVLAPWLQRLEDEQRAAADAKRQEAERLAEVAAQTARDANPDSLADQTALQHRRNAAQEATQSAARLDKVRPQARGGERAVTLRTSYRGEVTDALAFGKWAWEHRRGEYLAFLDVLAEREARAGPKSIPGLTIHQERKAV